MEARQRTGASCVRTVIYIAAITTAGCAGGFGPNNESDAGAGADPEHPTFLNWFEHNESGCGCSDEDDPDHDHEDPDDPDMPGGPDVDEDPDDNFGDAGAPDNDDDDDDDEPCDEEDPESCPLRVYVSGLGSISVHAQSLVQIGKPFHSGHEHGLAVDLLGNAYQASSAGDIVAIAKLDARLNGQGTNAAYDRTIDVGVDIRGIVHDPHSGWIFAADVGANAIIALGAGGNTALTVATEAELGANVLDLDYDHESDTLFVTLGDGSILCVDLFVASGLSFEHTRRIFLDLDAAVLLDLRGIAYVSATDQLVVTNAGATNAEQGINFAVDGQILVIDNASTASGSVAPTRIIEGAHLGDPIDIAIDGHVAFVVDSLNNTLLRFDHITSGQSGLIAASATIHVSAALGVTLARRCDTVKKRLSLELSVELNAMLKSVVFNHGHELGALLCLDAALRLGTLLDVSLLAKLSLSLSSTTIESVRFDMQGSAYVSMTQHGLLGSTGRVVFMDRLGIGRGDDAHVRDRVILDASAKLVRPRGLDVSTELGLLFQADLGHEHDPGSGCVKTYGLLGTGLAIDVIAHAVLGADPWGVEYDTTHDRLFVALVNGEIAIFDDWSEGRTTVDRRVRVVAADGSLSVNLHGIVYVADEDKLIVSDIGLEANVRDGRIFVLDNASNIDGSVHASLGLDDGDRQRLGLTLLGNPVDIAFDGHALFVAERSSDKVLRFDGLLEAGFVGGDTPPSSTLTAKSVTSVSLLSEE